MRQVKRHGPITTAQIPASLVRPILHGAIVQDPLLQIAVDRTAIVLQSNIAPGHKRIGLEDEIVSQEASLNPVVQESSNTIFHKSQYSSLMLEKQRASEVILTRQAEELEQIKRQWP